MRTVTRKYNLYKFNELSQEAKDKVINNAIQFFIEAVDYSQMSPDMQQAVDRADKMQTPWFVGSYIWEYCKAEVMDFINLNPGEYLSDGSILGDKIKVRCKDE